MERLLQGMTGGSGFLHREVVFVGLGMADCPH